MNDTAPVVAHCFDTPSFLCAYGQERIARRMHQGTSPCTFWCAMVSRMSPARISICPLGTMKLPSRFTIITSVPFGNCKSCRREPPASCSFVSVSSVSFDSSSSGSSMPKSLLSFSSSVARPSHRAAVVIVVPCRASESNVMTNTTLKRKAASSMPAMTGKEARWGCRNGSPTC